MEMLLLSYLRFDLSLTYGGYNQINAESCLYLKLTQALWHMCIYTLQGRISVLKQVTKRANQGDLI